MLEGLLAVENGVLRFPAPRLTDLEFFGRFAVVECQWLIVQCDCVVQFAEFCFVRFLVVGYT